MKVLIIREDMFDEAANSGSKELVITSGPSSSLPAMKSVGVSTSAYLRNDVRNVSPSLGVTINLLEYRIRLLAYPLPRVSNNDEMDSRTYV